MARIRTVKPEFFRDEELQALEVSHPELKPMLFFEGLWCQADRLGNFPWKPKTLHLDILPFIEFNPSASLLLLCEAGLLSRYTADDGKEYGHVRTFYKHQRISGKEAQDAPKFPIFTPGSIREASEKHEGLQEGKGKGVQEREKERVSPEISENSFALDTAVTHCLFESGLAGRPVKDVVREILYQEAKKLDVDLKDAAEAMASAWRSYNNMELPFKLSPENFFGRGEWRKTESQWEGKKGNGNGKSKDEERRAANKRSEDAINREIEEAQRRAHAAS